MEDAHTTILDMKKESKHVSFFAVFDGHGGPSVAQYVGQNLHKKVKLMPAVQQGDYREALRTSFFSLDEDITNGTFFGCR